MDVEMPDPTNRAADSDKKKQLLSGIPSKDDKQPTSLEDIDSLTIEGILLVSLTTIIYFKY